MPTWRAGSASGWDSPRGADALRYPLDENALAPLALDQSVIDELAFAVVDGLSQA